MNPKSPHPGPWFVKETAPDVYYYVYDANGGLVAETPDKETAALICLLRNTRPDSLPLLVQAARDALALLVPLSDGILEDTEGEVDALIATLRAALAGVEKPDE